MHTRVFSLSSAAVGLIFAVAALVSYFMGSYMVSVACFGLSVLAQAICNISSAIREGKRSGIVLTVLSALCFMIFLACAWMR